MSSRFLRRVTERVPVPVYLAQQYTTFHIRETLECGHVLITYPQGDPLIAKYRTCPECAQASVALPPKKPPQPVRTPAWRLKRSA